MKIKTYDIYKSGSTKHSTIQASCITKATKQFIESLDHPAKYEIANTEYSRVIYNDNHTIMSDFVIIQA